MTDIKAVDVVIVPDFLGPKAMIFETRTIFFLATWLAYAGSAAKFPLHLACIGEPPPQIKWLAKRANAHITVHEPHPLSRQIPFINKTHGFSVNAQTDHMLLLDVDCWVLSDFSAITALGNAISVAPHGYPRVPPAYWERIFSAFDMALPIERMRSLRGEYGISLGMKPIYPNQAQHLNSMLPYYNTGVLYAPWACDFKDRWIDNSIRISQLFADEVERGPKYKSVAKCDQAAFAFTLLQLRQENTPFVRLPASLHGNRVHLYAKNGLRVDEVKIYHATRFAEDPIRPVSHYARRLINSMRTEWRMQYPDSSALSYLRHYAPAHTRAIISLLQRIRHAFKTEFADVYGK